MALDGLDDDALEALMAKANNDDSDDDGMMYGVNSLPDNLPPPEAQEDEAEEEPVAKSFPSFVVSAPTFVIAQSEKAPSFVINVPTTTASPSLVSLASLFELELGVAGNTVEKVAGACASLGLTPDGKTLKEQAEACWHQLGRPAVPDAPTCPKSSLTSFESPMLKYALDRDEASRLADELRAFLGVSQADALPAAAAAAAEPSAAWAAERVDMNRVIKELRASIEKLKLDKEEVEADAAAAADMAARKLKSVEAKMALAEAQAEMVAAAAAAEARAAAEVQRAEAAEARKTAALEAHREAQAYEAPPPMEEGPLELEAPARVFNFSAEAEAGAPEEGGEDESGGGGGGKKASIGAKVLRSLSFGKRTKKK